MDTRTHMEQMVANALRVLAMDAVQKANSGHPGMPMGAADMATVLWLRYMRFDPTRPKWPNRDRFVLSAGHGSMLLYGLLHLLGLLTLEDLKQFRQWGSRTPGHPEYGHTPGVETTTGPLGQGFANGVGMALAERMLAARFNREGFPLFDHYTYGIVSDGDLMEGISHEAASLAGHWGLGRLIYLYDDNDISIDGPTDLAFTEDVATRFRGYGWQVLDVDGHDREAVAQALEEARRDMEHPSLIIAHTHIAYGSPHKQDTAEAHGAPLGEEEVRLTKRNLGWPEEPPFYVPQEVYDYVRSIFQVRTQEADAWYTLLEEYRKAYPEEARMLDHFLQGTLPPDWNELVPVFGYGKAVATRSASGTVLNALARKVPQLAGGSADLTPSNKTALKDETCIRKGDYRGRYIHFGVREHAMGGIANGLALHYWRPFVATFLVFSDYMRPAIRMAALMGLPVIYIFTHDSIFVGEDGPTHQPVEHLASLRAMPNLVVIRPADANEVAEAWQVALERTEGPTALILTRQEVPTLDRTNLAPASGLRRGGYILAKEPGEGLPDAILLASGSEVALAVEAWERLIQEGIRVRVVNMASWELFEAQPHTYRETVLPPQVTARVAVEAGVSLGWERYVGPQGVVVSVECFGASAPYTVLAEKYGFTVARVVDAVRRVLRRETWVS